MTVAASRPRRWYQFSLRTMLEVIFVVAAVLAIWANMPRADRITPGTLLDIQVIGAPPDAPINGVYRVDSGGDLVFGPGYKSVHVYGLTRTEATTAISKSLKQILT